MSDKLSLDDRLELSKESYHEVLDATKHQDDKIGRFLTAAAFLFTGAIAFGTRSGALELTVSLDGYNYRLPSAFLGVFLGLTLISVLLLIIAVGPNLALPRGPGGTREFPGDPEGSAAAPPPPSDSWLFFLSIAGKTSSDWAEMWYPGQLNKDELVQHYAREAHNIAVKTEFKYNRTNEARAVFTLGLLFLSLAVVLFFAATARGEESLVMNGSVRGWMSAIIAVYAFALAYDYFRLDQALDLYARAGGRAAITWPLAAIAIAAPLYVVSILLLTELQDWVAPVGILSAGVIGASGVWARRQGRSHLWWAWIAVGAIGLLTVLGYCAVHRGLERAQLALAVAIVGLLELPRLLVATRTLVKRRSKIQREGGVPSLRAELSAWKKEAKRRRSSE